MARITIQTAAYSRNRHFLEITDELAEKGFTFTTNVAVDGEVSIDTNAPRDVCFNMIYNRPSGSVMLVGTRDQINAELADGLTALGMDPTDAKTYANRK